MSTDSVEVKAFITQGKRVWKAMMDTSDANDEKGFEKAKQDLVAFYDAYHVLPEELRSQVKGQF